MKSDTDILTAAAAELGWTIHLNDAPHHAYQGWVGTRDGSHFEPLPDWLTSLDAHFAPRSTVEMMQSAGRGIAIIWNDRNKQWEISIYAAEFFKMVKCKTNTELPRAMTTIFLKWRQPQENW